MFQRAFSVTPRQVNRAYAARASLPTVRQLHVSSAAFKNTTEKVTEVADKVCIMRPEYDIQDEKKGPDTPGC